MLNSSVCLGRTGVPVSYISEFARDKLGDFILEFLVNNNVSTDNIYLYEGSSPLALAFLNDRKDAEYEFYEDFPEERLNTDFPYFAPDDILMFGSILSVTEEARQKLREILICAKKAGSLVLYDPNFRTSQLPILDKIKPIISENIGFSDIVRASDEDMKLIFDCDKPDTAYSIIREKGCNYFVYTSSSNGVYLMTPLFSKYYAVPDIETVSTIGAGDSFNAGIAFMLYSRTFTVLEDLSELEWDSIIEKAIQFASDTCMSTENYISSTFASNLKLT